MSVSRIFSMLPNPMEGEPHFDFFQRMKEELPKDLSISELMEATRVKCHQQEARVLFNRISSDEDMVAMRTAIAMLLKETYRL